MAEMTKEEMLKIVEDNISKIENKNFNVYFFVLDTKGNPSSSLEYIYQTAYVLSNMGYNVAMLHQEKEFVGVGSWLGEKYAEMKHYNIDSENVEISPSDFLFIPEIFANVMMQTKKLPCKRVMLVQNYNHICEFLPVSQDMESLNITDAVVTTKVQAEKVKKFFPTLRTHIVSPSIKKCFRKQQAPQKLVVNIICKEQSDVNQIVKSFYWENPLYKWVSFKDLRGLNIEDFATALSDAAITIWADDKTNFGYTLLEALRSGGVVMAKIPNKLSDWMVDAEGKLTRDVLWFNSLDDVSEMIGSAVRSWTLDGIPDDCYESQDKFSELYSEENQEKEIKEVYVDGLFAKRLNDFKEAKVDIENNVFKANK